MSFEQITTIELAFQARNIDFEKMPDVSMIPERLQNYVVKNYQKVVAIEAVNEGWIPDYDNDDQDKWEIWMDVIIKRDAKGNVTGSGLSLHDIDFWRTSANAGARLCFQTEAQARHFWKYFQPLCEEVDLIQ